MRCALTIPPSSTLMFAKHIFLCPFSYTLCINFKQIIYLFIITNISILKNEKSCECPDCK